MRKFGLIGYPLGHSFSKRYFTGKFAKENIRDCSYENYPLEKIELLGRLIAGEKELCGLNVTIPHKQQVFPWLDELDEEAGQVGAVNCIRITRGPGNTVHLKGFNTDTYGFEVPLLEVLQSWHTKALILGTGGASKAVAHVLGKHGIGFRYVSRKPLHKGIYAYSDLTDDIIAQHTIIVNTSPKGMHPDTAGCPDIPYRAITGRHILYDLVYNPEKTVFLQKGKEKNAILINGLPMLHLQAEKSWEIWNTK
jgi:shikimate dehydrogenase